MGGPRWGNHRLRAELHPHDQGRLSRITQGPTSSPVRDDRAGLPDLRGVFRIDFGEKSEPPARLEIRPPEDPRASTLSPAIAGRYRPDDQAATTNPRRGGDRP